MVRAAALFSPQAPWMEPKRETADGPAARGHGWICCSKKDTHSARRQGALQCSGTPLLREGTPRDSSRRPHPTPTDGYYGTYCKAAVRKEADVFTTWYEYVYLPSQDPW